MPDVVYRDIHGFDGYRVGSDGSVWSCWKQASLGIGKGTRSVMSSEWRSLRLTTRPDGYLVVNLCRGGRRCLRRVHHLVLEAFVGPRPDGAEGCHYPDPDPANNRAVNLRWGTPRENQSDRIAHGTTNRGRRNGRAVLTESQVREIRHRHRCGLMPHGVTAAVASEFGVSTSTVRDIIARKRWECVE